MKLVLDTNVLIDASEDYFRYANRIIDLVISGNIQAFANAKTLRENRFLAAKKINDEGYLKKLEYFFDKINLVEPVKPLRAVEDPDDNKILESALACRADYLVTSDHHLLKLEKYEGVRIVRPDAFWQIWEEGSDQGWLKWLENFIH